MEKDYNIGHNEFRAINDRVKVYMDRRIKLANLNGKLTVTSFDNFFDIFVDSMIGCCTESEIVGYIAYILDMFSSTDKEQNDANMFWDNIINHSKMDHYKSLFGQYLGMVTKKI